MKNCTFDDSYIASPEFLATIVHIITMFTIPMYIYASFLILCKTPTKMRSAKKHLINLHFWTVLLDFTINIFSIPYAFFPTATLVLLGVGPNIGIPSRFLIYVIQAIVAALTSAAIAVFENRQYTLANKWRITKPWLRVVQNLFNYLGAMLIILPPYFIQFNPDEFIKNALKVIPCPNPKFYDINLTIVTHNATLMTICMGIQAIIFVPQATFFLFNAAYNLLWNCNVTMSKSTRNMQRNFLVGSAFQVTIPFCVIMCPISYIWFSVNFKYYNQAFNNINIILISLHGALSTIFLIVVHKPYRTHLQQITIDQMPIFRKKRSHITTMINTLMNSR